jgi:hypothetical protein
MSVAKFTKIDDNDTQTLKEFRTPNNMKPYKADEKRDGIDSVWNDAEQSFTVKFPPGTTFKEAFKLLHFTFQQRNNKLSLEINKNHMARLKEVTKFEDFFRRCRNVQTYFIKGVDELDLDLPGTMFDDSEQLTEQEAVKLCKAMVEKILKEKRKEEEEE